MRLLACFLLLLMALPAGWYMARRDHWQLRTTPIRQVDHLATAAPSAPAAPALSAPPSPPASARAQPPASPGFIELHSQAACLQTPTAEVTEKAGPRIWRWQDDEGSWHFGDRPPAQVAAETYEAGFGPAPDYFQLQVSYRGQPVVPFLQSRIDADVRGIYEIMQDFLGRERLRRIELNVLVFAEHAEYRRFAAATGGARLADAGGFYSPGSNQVVTYRYQENQRTRAVARHEALHAMLQGMLGRTPLWLNEGLAEYFELMHTEGQLRRVQPAADWLRLARASAIARTTGGLRRYLELPAEDWYGPRQREHYALAWSLVWFLLEGDSGPRVLGRVMRALADDHCAVAPGNATLAAVWPGGLPGLERDFRTWLASAGPLAPHRY